MFSAGAILQFASELAGALHVRLDPEDSPSSSFASSQSASRYPSSAVSSNPAHPHFFLRDRVEEGTSVEAGREAKGEKKNNKLLSNATFQDEPEGFVSFQTSSFSPSSPHSSFSLSSSFSSCSHSKQQAERVPSPPPPCPSSFSSSPRHLCQRHLAPASPLASVETDQRHLRKQENRVAISTVKDECFALPTPSTTPFSLKNPLSSSSSSSSVLTPSIPSSSSSSPLSLSSAKNISQEIFRPSQNPYEETNSGVKRRGDSLTSLIPDHRHLFLASSFLSPPPSSSSPLAPSSSSSSSLFCSSSSLPGEKGLSRHWMNEEEIEKDQIDQEKERNLSREAPFLVSPHKEPSPPHLLTRTTTMGAEQSNRSGGGGEEGREGLDEDILQRQGRRSIIEGREEHLSSSSSLGFPSQGQSARPHHHLFRHSSEAKPPPYPGDTRGGEEEGVRGERDGEEEEEERSSQKGSAFQNLFSSAHASPHLPSSGHEEPRDGHGAEGDAQRRSSVTREGREEKEEARRRGGGSHVGHTGGNSSSSNSGMPASTSPSTFASGLVPSVLSRSATWASSLLGRRSTSTPAHQTPTPNQSNNASSSSHDPPAYSDFPTGLSPPFPLYPSSSTPSSSSAFPLHPLQGQHLERTSGLHSGNFSSAQSSSSSSHIRSIEGRQVPSDLPEGPSGLHSSRSGTDSFTSSSSMAIGGFDKAYTSVNLPPKKAPVLPPHFLFQPGSIREAILQPGVAPDALRHRSRYHYCHHPQSSLQQSLQGREEEEEGRGGGIAPPPSTEEYRKTSTGVYTRRSHQHDALPPHSYTSSYPSPLLPLYGRSFSSEEEGEEDLGEHRRQGEDEKIDEANSHLNSSRPDAGKDEKNRGKVLPLSSHFPHEGKGASEGRFSPLSSSTGAAAGADHPSVDREDEGSSSVARSDVDQRKGREEEEEEEEEEGDSSSSCLPQKKKKEKERGKQLSTEERGACGFKTSVSHSPHTPHRPQVHTELHQPQQVLSSSSFVPKEALERKEEGREEEEEERGDQVTTFPPEHSNPFLPNRSSSSSSGGGGGGLFSFFLGGGERNHNSSQAIGTEEGEKGDTLLKRKGVNGVLSPKSHSHDSSSSSSSSSSTFASTLGGHQPSSLDGSLLMNSKASSRDSYFSSLRHHTHSYLHRTSSTQDQEKKDSHGERGSAGDVERGEDGEWNLVKNQKEEEKKEYFRRRGTALLDFWKDQQDKEDERIALQRGEAKCVYCAGDRLIPGVLSIEREALKFRREQDLQLLSSSSSSQSTDDSPRPLPPYVSISLIDVLECACVSPPPPPSSSSCVVEGEEDEEKHLPSTPLSPSSSSSSSSSSCYLNLSPLPLSASSSAHRLPSSSEGISESKKSRRDCLPWSASHNKNALSSSSSLVQSPRSEREREKLSHHDRDPVMYLQLLLSTLEASSHLKEEGQWDKRQDQHLQGKGSPCSSSQGDDGEKKEPKRNEGGGDKGDDSLEEGPRDKKEKKGGTTSKSHGGVGGVDDKRRREEQEEEEGKRRGEEEEKGEEGGLYPPMSMPIASNYDTPCSRFSPLSSFSSSDRLGGLVGGEGALAEKEEEKNKDDEEEKRKSRQETDDGEEKNEEEEKGLGNTGSSSSSTDEQRKKSTKQQEGHQDCRSLLSSHDKILPIPHEDKQHIQSSSSSSSSEMLAKNIIKRPEPLQAGSPRPSLPSPDPLVSTDLPSSYHQPPHGHLSSPIPVDPSSSLHYYDPVDIVVGNKPPHVQNLVSTDKDLSTTSPKITLSSSVVSPSSPSSSSCSPLPPPAPFACHQKSRESHEEASSGSSPVSDLRRTTTGHPQPLESIPSSSSSRHPDHHLTLSPSSFSPLSHHHDRSVYTPHDSAGDGEREGGGPLSQGSGMIGTGGRSSSSASFSLSPVRLLSSGAWGLMDLWRGLRRNHSSTAAVTCASSSSPMLEGRGDTSAGDVGGGDPRGIGGGGGRRESRGEEALPGGRLATEGGHRFRRRLSGLRGSDGMREEEERGGGGSRRHSLLHRTDTAGTVSSYHRRKKDLFTRQEGERNRDHSFSSLSRSSSSPPLLFVLFGFYKKDLALGITRAVLQFIDQCQSEHRGFRVVGTHVPFSSNALVDRWRGVGDDPSSMINSSFHHRGPAGEGGDMAVPTCSSPSLSVRSFNSLGSGEMTMTVTPQNPPSFSSSSSSSYYPHASSQHPHRRSPTRGGDERTISEEDLHRRQAGLPSSSSLAPSQLTLSPQARPHGGRLYRADSSSFSYQPPSRLSSSPRHKRRSSLSSSHEPPRIRSSTENDYPERNPTKEEEEEAEEGLHRRRHSITGLWHATHHRQDETKHRRKSKTSVSSSASPASLSFSSRLVSPVFHQHPDQQGSSSSSHFHRRASDVVTGAVGLGRRNSDTKNAGGGMMTRGRYSFLLHRNASSSSTSPIPGGDSHQLMREEERERDKKPGRDGILELQDDHEEEDNRKRDSHEEDDDEEEEEEEYDDEDEEEGSGENLVYADEPEQEEMYNKGDAYSLSSTHNFGSFRSRDRDLGSTSSLFTIPLPDYEIPQGAPALLNNNVVSQLAVHLPLMLTMKKWYLAFCHKLHGISLNTFYRRCSNIGPCVLLIQDGKGVLFGAFLDEIQLASKYYGTAETFVFTFKGSHGSNPDLDHASIHVYRWSKMNNYFIYTDYDVIGIGGGGHYAISVDKDLLRGSSSCCFTFNSPILSSSEDFIVKAFQVWSFEDY